MKFLKKRCGQGCFTSGTYVGSREGAPYESNEGLIPATDLFPDLAVRIGKALGIDYRRFL